MRKLLALNRGEISIRILRAANELGLRTVAIYSHEDRLALHRFKADEAYLIGAGKGPVEAYLDVDGIVALAREKGVDAIHPGYGFLSENPALPRACERAGITFIGPSAELLELLGDKTAARQVAVRAGIPVVPGTEDAEAIRDPRRAKRIARQIGFPLIVKAAFGGGGRGMRVVGSPAEFDERLAEARREAGAAFGNDAVFLERYVQHARHVEVQILGDRAGHILHLYERDCSVQRRHQKVVEVAPAVGLDDGIRQALAEAAVKLTQAVGYYNAGTVEFLVDAASGAWYFIEVNPRIQVEHTVTEMVTGIDLVRCQIQVAQGLDLFGPEMNLPRQEQMPLYGFALQCRITTEDPANHFVPDYGKIHTYRSPAGFGIRLDGGSAYSGAVITPYYDSLLVKTTAWGRDFRQACQRMDRCLREFRVRGVKTNIPFLENVVNHPDFQAGRVTTSWLEQTPELFRFVARRDRATRLLTYLGEVIVNGNPTVAGKTPPPRMDAPPVPPRIAAAPLPGTRQLLAELGPEKFAEWTRSQNRLLLTDTTFRDAHQSLLATRVRTCDMLRIAGFISRRLPTLYSLEMWGGATFDVAMRFLHEDPWLRLRQLRDAIPNICFQMLLRASNAVGYTAYPDNVVEEFIYEAAAQGIDIFRIFDSLNWLPNMKVAMEAVRKTAKICEAVRLLHRRHSRSAARQVFAAVLRQDGQGAGAHGRARARHQGYGRPVQAIRGRKAGERAAAGNRDPHPFPHARYQRRQCGFRIEGSRGGRRRGRRGHRIDERRHQPAQPQFDGGRITAHSARQRPRSRCVESLRGLLGNRADLLCAVRYRAEVRHRGSVCPRDARRPVHQSTRAGRNHGAGRALA